MPANPETRESLILRLPKMSDSGAWKEFLEIYEPLVFRFARRRGLQEADALEVAQNVFIAVAKAVERWQPNPEQGKFRSWLFRIARNQLVNHVSKHRRDKATGRTAEWNLLYDLSDRSTVDADALQDYRREMFRLAAIQVRESVQKETWDAFWRTAVLDEDIELVAHELGLSRGAVYIARSRVTAKIRSLIEQWENDDVL
ncbi:RNA polymerase sigma factor [Pirellulaceae bacterium SH449]